MKLNRNKPFGKVSPPMVIAGMYDRPACFEQDGVLFDAHDVAIVPGVETDTGPIEDDKHAAVQPPVTPAPVPTPKAETEEQAMSVGTLLAAVDAMPYQTWARHARAILGPTCPAGKKAIIAALEEAKKNYENKQAKRAQFAAASAEAEAEAIAASPPPPPPAAASGGVDLAAWGRGQKDYLFGEVQKAARQQHNVQLSQRRAVVDFLIEAKIIRADEARRDV